MSTYTHFSWVSKSTSVPPAPTVFLLSLLQNRKTKISANDLKMYAFQWGLSDFAIFFLEIS